ncbi:hypothetical protein Cni_G03994 [Canna indica]|uniref:Uncharacterized protein n=1 Tax=Canna indica TaxID=4628 RepID=A0AAQ3Q430_9LILI|nr:hypothetical protein Cni_G03994 [Canna indica]
MGTSGMPRLGCHPQHFIVGSRLPPVGVSYVSDTGFSEVIVADPLLPSTSSVAAFAVDDCRRRLLVALANPVTLAAYDLRSPCPHRRIFFSPLPDPSAAPTCVRVHKEVLIYIKRKKTMSILPYMFQKTH